MKKTVLAIVVAMVVLVVAGGAVWALSGDDETSATGTCGGATYEMCAENDDAGLEVAFELQSAAPGETWNSSRTLPSWKPMVRTYKGTIGNQDAFYCNQPS
jgi:hypothetical protein